MHDAITSVSYLTFAYSSPIIFKAVLILSTEGTLMKISEAPLPEYDQEMGNTRKTLERVPNDKLDWKPHPKSFPMGSLATHICGLIGWTVDIFQKDSFDVAPVGAPPYKEEPAKSQKELLEKFDKNVQAARASIAGASDEHFMKNWSLLAGGKTLFTMPRVVCIRS